MKNDAGLKSMTDRVLVSRYGGIYVFLSVYMALSFVLRLILMGLSWDKLDVSFLGLGYSFGVGFLFDLVSGLALTIPGVLLAGFFSDKKYRSATSRRLNQMFYVVVIFGLLFNMVAQVAFWDEFGVRYNFIAVDYLIYTNEVLHNIWESYPIVGIVAGLFGLAMLIFWMTRRCYIKTFDSYSTLGSRLRTGLILCALPLLGLWLVNPQWSERSKNQYLNELSKNGMYCFVNAFSANSLNYNRFYLTEDLAKVFPLLKEQLGTAHTKWVGDEKNPYDLTREITHGGEEKRYNVMLVVVESLSGRFLKRFGNQANLTPHLDRIMDESLAFTRFYATGTRTTRGLEAITLSLPPTPGRSLVKRPDNGNLFNMSTVFGKRGYDCRFLYGGNAFFDNMEAFFSGNGFEVIDNQVLSDKEITFSTAWGACDEDMFHRAIKEGDRSYAAGKPFFSLIMTTSNHRPYTYPQKIDIPSGQGRGGAVKYTDYAIHQLLEEAKGKAWFKNTLFVIVADHCANSAGKVEVPLNKYHIPFMIYGPDLVVPGVVDKLGSQIDLAPTLFGLLNFSYRTKFFGRDLLGEGVGRALVGNYQKIGLLVDGDLSLLLPNKKARQYHWDGAEQKLAGSVDRDLLLRTISYYQSAAYVLEHDGYDAE